MEVLIENIKGLILAGKSPSNIVSGNEMKDLPVIDNAFLLIKDGLINAFGAMSQKEIERADKIIDASGRYVFPSFVDSHTHLIFAGSRENEFVHRIQGLNYQEIANKGGGILNSARRLHNTSELELFDAAENRLAEIISMGTGAVEIKSGYGLSTPNEIKMLRVAKKLKETSPITIKTTFLGAHAFPKEFTREKYVDTILFEMIPRVVDEGLADFIDVFCEVGFFTPAESIAILEQGIKYGLKPKLHANQLSNSGGVQVGVQCGAISVDHLESIGDNEIKCLVGSSTIPTLLPGAAFFLDMQYPPARKLIGAGLPVALASDFNPGSAPSGNMPLIVALSCIKMKMTPAEAIIASTINGAFALELQDQLGTISIGKKANIFISKPMPSIDYFPYSFGSNLVDTTILNGQIISGL